jgi:hypothetical protein
VLNKVYSFKPGKFIITIQNSLDEDEKKINVVIDENEETGIKGLPKEWNQELMDSGFTKNEIIQNPMEVLGNPLQNRPFFYH